jgi:hypothetical protein
MAEQLCRSYGAPIRFCGRGHLHFITFSCYRRLRLLGSVRARNVFVKTLGETRDRYGALRDTACGTVGMKTAIHLGK